ncbi:MAG: gliding motility-associated C-terminal domain-containing protein [Hymenobacteraceae bacterium]|nr:gliding motility-associated C-terminal domain-containing protein [Hymenobacteraceae bacterium]
MSFSPESLDRLLAEKLTQVPPPAYEPAHWDQLEDHLQSLNYALQHTAPAGGVPAAGVAASKLVVAGFGALLAGLTAVNGYFFYATTTARSVARPIARVAPLVAAPIVAATSTGATSPAPVAAPLPPTASVRPAARPQPAPSQPGVARVAVPNPLFGPSPAAPAGGPAAESGPALREEPVVVASPTPSVPAPPAAAVEVRADSADEAFARPSAATSTLSLAVPNVITPNGDGLNDRLVLPLPAGACRLTVFDRANRVVFRTDHYDNAWDGGTLPAGQYMYFIETTGVAVWRTSSPLLITR